MKSYCIDIDGVIAQHNGICKTCKYESSTPIKENIEKINKLYDEGNIIKYFTARGMGTYDDSLELASARWKEFTEFQLKLWECKYHKLIMGKVSADYYIDDKAINSSDFFN